MFAIIKQANVGILETFGKFTRVLSPGIHLKIPMIQQVVQVGTNIKTQPLHFSVKTKDNVFADMHLTVSYKINDPKKAHYELENPTLQISSTIENVVRSAAPNLTLDDLYNNQDHIKNNVTSQLSNKMSSYGYEIEDVMVTGVEPAEGVRIAMNEINASIRRREAATNDAEAEKIRIIKHAEADRERKKLNGEGIALQRSAIIGGIDASIRQMSDNLRISPREAMIASITTQHMDAIQQISQSNNTKIIFTNHSPTAGGDAMAQLRQSIMEATESEEKVKELK
ncbi:hypersensitive-induced response protein [Acrasis kona]|uniref:Hypersensitive-induced response protein n=1 Tax=Acrasis kona TaxID=1008807 RepID=A0AAW2Z7I7_9EUKA